MEADLHEVFAIDCDDAALMQARSWRWLRAKVLALLDRPPRLLAYQSGEHTKLATIPTTRLGYALTPPQFGEE